MFEPFGCSAASATREDLARDVEGPVDRYREADPDVARSSTAEGGDRGVDADDAAVEVDERPAGVAWVDRCIGLDHGFRGRSPGRGR